MTQTGTVQDLIRAARAVCERHQPRGNQQWCGFCGGKWHHTTILATGQPVAGCAARQVAGPVLARHGHLDEHGDVLPASPSGHVDRSPHSPERTDA